MGEVEQEESISSSEASFDLAPINQEFKQLADSLRETNQNLHTFEFMLGQYKKLAKVAPLQNDNNNLLEAELKRIAKSIQSIESREGNLTSELEQIKTQLSPKVGQSPPENVARISFLEGTILELKAQLEAKEVKCLQMMEANHRISTELSQEREKSLALEKKLDSERKAAQIVSKDVQKYVEYAKSLEAQIKVAKKEESCLDNSQEKLTLDSSILCKTCLGDDATLQNVADRVEKLAENIEQKNAQILDEFKTQKAKKGPRRKEPSFQLDLAEITAERDSLLCINEKIQKEIQILLRENEAKEEKHKSLKSKCKALLSKHRKQSEDRSRINQKLRTAKRALISVESLCQMHEKNHALLMNYFSGQVQVLGRLLSTFMGEDYGQKLNLHVENYPKLTEWFCNVHAVLVWTQKQLVSLGERLWLEGFSPLSPPKTEKSEKKLRKTAVDINTLSDISHSLDKDERWPNEMVKMLENHQTVVECTRDSVKELRQVLSQHDQSTSSTEV